MIVPFTKMQGIGNDFMVVDAISQPVYLNQGQISQLAHRNFGIGFDQLLMIEAPQHPEADFTSESLMRMVAKPGIVAMVREP